MVRFHRSLLPVFLFFPLLASADPVCDFRAFADKRPPRPSAGRIDLPHLSAVDVASALLPKNLIDRDHIIILPPGAKPVELVPDNGFTFGNLTIDGDGFKAILKPLGTTEAQKTIRFDAKGNPRA